MYAKVILVCLFAVAAAQVEDPPQPYSFNVDSTDEFGNRLIQSESGDANNAKTGTYGYQAADGTYRKVTYVADADGFRATVETNEPGTKSENPADVQVNANPQENPAPVAKPVVVAAKPVHVAHVVAAHPVVHAVHAVPVAYHHAPVAYTLGKASRR
ncbi:cuticle protein 10.9-like [Ornithodoros turicata]|uniref:cuticle protein 10.9-like n=1 Tax=Ornithodoros turicata TaxID=34597 RepID=UPI00313952A5